VRAAQEKRRKVLATTAAHHLLVLWSVQLAVAVAVELLVVQRRLVGQAGLVVVALAATVV
jgi:hypothetical protein